MTPPVLALLLAACGLLPSAERAPPPELQCETNKADGCFRRVEGATFLMGAQAADPGAPGHDPDAQPDEGPPHEVTVASFWLTDREMPLTTWRRCADSGACVPSAEGAPQEGLDANRGVVAGITWTEARALCAYVGGRLPTEAEWELAARGTDGRRYPWGNDAPCGLGTSRNYFDELPRTSWGTIAGCEGQAEPRSPRGFSPSQIADMAWGHWEWVEDGFAPYPSGPVRDPKGPADAPLKVQRGGSWAAETPADVRSTVRVGMPPDARVFDVGVRCAW